MGYRLLTRKVVVMADEKKPHETLKERFDDFKADVDVHKAEHQEKDAIKDVERAAKHDAKSDVDLDKAAANVGTKPLNVRPKPRKADRFPIYCSHW